MIHTSVVHEQLSTTLKTLMVIEELQDFLLVGDTAVALQLGHRESDSIDLFSTKSHDLKGVNTLMLNYFSDVQVSEQIENSVKMVLYYIFIVIPLFRF